MGWFISTLKRLLTPLTMQFCYGNLRTMDLIWVPYDSLGRGRGSWLWVNVVGEKRYRKKG